MSGNDEGSDAPPLPRDAQDRIGSRLKEMYDSVVREPIPDRFKELLDRLSKTETPDKGGDGTESPQS